MNERERLEDEYIRSYDVPEGCLILTVGLAVIGVMFTLATIVWIIKNIL